MAQPGQPADSPDTQNSNQNANQKLGTAQPSPVSFYSIKARDTAKNEQDLYAAYKDGQFALFRLDEGDVAQVMYLLSAPSAAEIPRVITQRIIDVTDARPIDKPAFSAAALLTSHNWTDADRGLLKTLLGTSDLR